MIRQTILILAFFATLSGCATTKILQNEHKEYTPFKGVSNAGKNFIRSFSEFDYYGEQNIYLADVLLCGIADTIILPYGIFNLLSPDPQQHTD